MITVHPVTTVPTLSAEEAFERFLRLSTADGSASPRTISAYRQGVTIFFSWCKAAAVDPKAATYADLEGFRGHLKAQGFKRATIKLRLTATRIFFNSLVRWGIRPDNPAAGLRAPKESEAAVHSVLRKALSVDEAKRFLAALPQSWAPQDIRDATICRLMLFHGLRAAEVCAIRATDLDYSSFTVLRVRGKGSKERALVLCPEVRNDLLDWTKAASQPQEVAWKFEKAHPTIGTISVNVTPLFYRLDRPGLEPLSVRTLERIVDFYLKKAGLKQPGRSCHSLRHTSCVLAILGGAKTQALAESMGHANVATTDVYARAAAAWQEAPADCVGRALKEVA